MELGLTTAITIMTEDFGTLFTQCGRHALRGDRAVNPLVVRVHIGERLVTERTSVMFGGVYVEAMRVHGVAAFHEHDGAGGCVQIQAANGAIGVQRLAQAAMLVLEFERHARVAAVAMEVVMVDALADAADLAAVAMVDVFARLVIEELADGAEVARELHVARDALVGHGLVCMAQHAQDLGSVKTYHGMVHGGVIVTLAAYHQEMAALGAQLTVARIVLAAQQTLVGVRVEVFGIGWLASLLLQVGGELVALHFAALAEAR